MVENKKRMVNSAYKILLVDDEPDITEFIGYNLRREGFHVSVAHNGKSAIETAQDLVPHLIILDIMMPGMDGIETCEKLRNIPALKNAMIVFLTARGEDYSQIAGFAAGGDDYITKPIKPRVLVSRIHALLKRLNKTNIDQTIEPQTIQIGELLIDRERYTASKSGEDLILPKKEFELLNLLISKPGKVFTRHEIFQLVWGDDVVVGDRTIDVHIRKLREKIGEAHIVTVKGVGYKFIE